MLRVKGPHLPSPVLRDASGATSRRERTALAHGRPRMPATPLPSYNCNTPNAKPLPSYACNVCGAKGEHWRVNCPKSAPLAV